MALGTPVAAAAAYSAVNGTTVTPAYPASIAATDVVLLFVGQKPSTANGGTVTTPSGWTLRDSLTAAGGYGATLGADTGNTNLFIYSWNTPVAGQTGNLSVTVGTNNICWAFMVRIPTGGGAEFYGAADGQRTTAPTTNVSFTVALTDGTSATNFQVDDLAIWAMCIPTDNTTPTGFSGQSITATGATFGTAVELNEPDSNVGNDIGGYSAYAFCTAGSSTTAPSVSVTPSGTQANVDNIRGPVVLLRVREARTIDAAVGTFSYTGQDATLTSVRNINAEAGSFSYIGQDATLTSAKNVNAEAGAFSYVGQDAELIYVQAAKVLDAEAGSFSYAGQDATLNRTYSFNAEAGAFSYTGQDASFAQGFAVSADAGTFSYIGQDAALNRTYSFNAEAGSFSYIGQDATFIRTLSFTAEAGAFGEADPYVDPGYVDPYYATNLTAALGYGRVFNAESGTFIIAGQPATFLITALFPPESDVRAGVVYGPGGIYVGTYVPSTKQPIYVFDD